MSVFGQEFKLVRLYSFLQEDLPLAKVSPGFGLKQLFNSTIAPVGHVGICTTRLEVVLYSTYRSEINQNFLLAEAKYHTHYIVRYALILNK